MSYEERRWTGEGGLSLYARDYAGAVGEDRLPVICLHGLTRNSKDFEEVAPAIAATDRRVLVPDVRGRGQSDRDPEPSRYHPKTYARDVLAMMDSLGIEKAIFLGTSMGGLIMLIVAGLRSKAMAAAIINEAGPKIAPEGLERILSYAGGDAEADDWKSAADYARRINQVAFPEYGAGDWDRFARRLFRDEESGPVLDYDPAITTPFAKGPSRLASLAAWMLFRKLARKRPTLLIRGSISDIITPDIAARMQRHAPGLRQVEVPGVGHAPMLTEPVAARAIRDFLAELP